jgi:hypothetical protein
MASVFRRKGRREREREEGREEITQREAKPGGGGGLWGRPKLTAHMLLVGRTASHK